MPWLQAMSRVIDFCVQVVSIERIAPQRSKAPEAKILAKTIEYVPQQKTVEIF